MNQMAPGDLLAARLAAERANPRPLSVVPGEHHIELASGRYLDLRDPSAADIAVEDIATGLSQTCRFAGQSKTFYSVAEHACLVHDHLKASNWPSEILFAALHHDAVEAFLGDCTRPLKALLSPAFGNVEASGNALVPEIPYRIGRRILEWEEGDVAA